MALVALGAVWLWQTGAPENMDWATPVTTPRHAGQEIEELLAAYGESLVTKDQQRFLATLDPEATEFYAAQEQMFERLRAVPFSAYQVNLTGVGETGPGRAVAKVTIAWTLSGSFADMPDPERAAFALVEGDDGWKLAGDASAEALGRPRPARLEDFAPVETLVSEHAVILYQPPNRDVAAEAAGNIDAAWPRLESLLPGTGLPRVIVRVFDNKEQIEAAFPGQWQEWTGGGSRPLGDEAGQGGEIVIEAGQYRKLESSSPGYNQRMLSHELTHVALFPLSGKRTPPFLVEGLADYVAEEKSVILLPDRLKNREPLSPSLSDLSRPGSFSALLSTESAQLAYEISDTAVAYLEQQYGNERVLELLREFERRQGEAEDQDAFVDETFRAVLGVSWQDFESGWRRFVVENY